MSFLSTSSSVLVALLGVAWLSSYMTYYLFIVSATHSCPPCPACTVNTSVDRQDEIPLPHSLKNQQNPRCFPKKEPGLFNPSFAYSYVPRRNYTFTFALDWFTGRIPSFAKHLLKLDGSKLTLLEIGSHEGRSTTWMIDSIMSNRDSTLTCIDVEPREIWFKNVEMSGRKKQVTMLNGTSFERMRSLPMNAYDFIYVDGHHSTQNVLEDVVTAFRLVKPGGIVACDDYDWYDRRWAASSGAPRVGLDVFLAIYAPKIEVLESMAEQVWFRKRFDSPAVEDQTFLQAMAKVQTLQIMPMEELCGPADPDHYISQLYD